jgi:hypothetical protein
LSKKRKARHADSDDVEPKDNQELETEDIYNDAQRETMLKDDEITASENAFMEGREMDMKKKSKSSHDDSISVELSKKEYEED